MQSKHGMLQTKKAIFCIYNTEEKKPDGTEYKPLYDLRWQSYKSVLYNEKQAMR